MADVNSTLSPAPWRLSLPGECQANPESFTIVAFDGTEIADILVSCNEDFMEQGKRDGLAMAAAPELLEALEALSAAVNLVQAKGPPIKPGPIAVANAAAARAIAKAKGCA